MNGIARPMATRKASLKGTVNGDTTLVAISVAPAGSFWLRGLEMNVNSWFMYKRQGMQQTATANAAFISRSRSSSRCEISVPSASSLAGSSGSLMGRVVLLRGRRFRRNGGCCSSGRRRRGGGARLGLLQDFLGVDFALELLGQLPCHHTRAAHPIA